MSLVGEQNSTAEAARRALLILHAGETSAEFSKYPHGSRGCTARHESGHAVVGWSQGRTVEKIEIFPGGGGVTVFSGLGPVTEEALQVRDGTAVARVLAIMQTDPNLAEQNLDELRLDCRALVLENWRTIEAVARALILESVLDGERFLKIVNGGNGE